MSQHPRTTRWLTSGPLLAGGLIGATLFCGIPSALADQDPAADPPNCTSADLAGVRSGVEAATSAYLFSHPDVNYFVTSLEAQPRGNVATAMATYLKDNPQTKADLAGIRQPLVDIRDRCGAPPSPASP